MFQRILDDMFQRIMDAIKDRTESALRTSCLAATAAAALFVTTSFLCAAAFVAVLQQFGLIEACLAGAGAFLVLALIAAAGYLVAKRRAKIRAVEARKRAVEASKAASRSAVHDALADPMLLTAGLQLVRAVGIKRLLPMVALGGVALGLLVASRRDAPNQAPAE